MKITCKCTKAEKETLLNALIAGELCIYEGDFSVCYGAGYCRQCLEKKIEWEIEDGE